MRNNFFKALKYSLILDQGHLILPIDDKLSNRMFYAKLDIIFFYIQSAPNTVHNIKYIQNFYFITLMHTTDTYFC